MRIDDYYVNMLFSYSKGTSKLLSRNTNKPVGISKSIKTYTAKGMMTENNIGQNYDQRI